MFNENPKMEKPRETPRVNWSGLDMEQEQGEVERTARELSISLTSVANAVYEGRLTELSDEVWSRLENTDSRDINLGDLDKAKKLAEEAGRDWQKILKGIEEYLPMRSPIILMKKDGTPYLVAGNTRLMLCKALGIRPRVILGTLKK